MPPGLGLRPKLVIVVGGAVQNFSRNAWPKPVFIDRYRAGATVYQLATSSGSTGELWAPRPISPACKLAAESTFAVAGPTRDAFGDPRYRLVSGSLPYLSGVPSYRSLVDRPLCAWNSAGD